MARKRHMAHQRRTKTGRWAKGHHKGHGRKKRRRGLLGTLFR